MNSEMKQIVEPEQALDYIDEICAQRLTPPIDRRGQVAIQQAVLLIKGALGELRTFKSEALKAKQETGKDTKKKHEK